MSRIVLLVLILACGLSLGAGDASAEFVYSTSLSYKGSAGTTLNLGTNASGNSLYTLAGQSGTAANGPVSILSATANPFAYGNFQSTDRIPVVITITITNTSPGGSSGMLILQDVLSGTVISDNSGFPGTFGNFSLAASYGPNTVPFGGSPNTTSIVVDGVTFALPTSGDLGSFVGVLPVLAVTTKTSIFTLSVTPALVPEPASILLVGLGGLASAAFVRRRELRRSAV